MEQANVEREAKLREDMRIAHEESLEREAKLREDMQKQMEEFFRKHSGGNN